MALVRQTFFDQVRPLFGGSFKQPQVDGLDAILTQWETRLPGGDLRWLAYMLATAFHETNQQMQPVREAYWLSEDWRRTHLSYYPYYGRGYVQLTHKDNYQRAGTAVGRNLVDHPDDALDAEVAASVMFVGMEQGWFRASGDGKRHSLPRYFSATVDDPDGARKIINGAEYKKVGGTKVLLATIISQYHRAFLGALQASVGAAPAAVPAAAVLAAVAAPVVLAAPAIATAPAPAPAAAVPTPAPAPAAAAGGYAQRMVQIAGGEWEFFGRQTYDLAGHATHVGHSEGEDGWAQRVGRYFLEGTGTPNIDGTNTDWAWSAAFVSWVAKQAGAGTRFRYSTQHSVFIALGIRDYLNKRADAGFWTMRLNEAKPVAGDIICWGREAGIDYDHQAGGNYKGHSDHVVAVEANQIWVMGGNVGNSVTKRPIPLNAAGFLDPHTMGGENLFGLMKNRLG